MFKFSKTKTGLNLVTYEMPQVNSVAINIIVKVGSRYETLQEAGISHFLEHMTFKGTTNRTAKDIAIEFDKIGGHFNAYTSRENTVYYTKVLAQHIKQAVSILADILQNSLFDKEDIAKELNVITQEIAEVKDNPDELVYEKFYSLAYPDQSLGRSILGTLDSIAKFEKSSFIEYMSRHYHLDNIVISMAGKVRHNEAINIVEELFSSFPTRESVTAKKSKYIGGKDIYIKELEQSTIALGFEGVSYSNLDEFYHAHILSVIFGGGLSSRLFQRIREELGLVYSIGSWLNSYSDSGIFSIYASTDHSNASKVLFEVKNEIDKIRTGVFDDEIARAKSQIESNILMAEEKPEYKSDEIGKNYSLFNKYFEVQEVMKIINTTSSKDLASVANKIFDTKPTLAVVGTPHGEIDF